MARPPIIFFSPSLLPNSPLYLLNERRRMKNPRISVMMSRIFTLFFLLPLAAFSKSTIEPCSGSDTCTALVGYTLYADLKVSELAALFQVDLSALLAVNSIDPSAAGVANHILPSGLFLRIPVLCSCNDGIRKSLSTRYKVRPSEALASVAGSVFAGLASADQIREANGITDPGAALDAGQVLAIPLPCTCFNNTDNMLPAVYLSYVVQPEDSIPAIASQYATTVNDIMNVNAMGSPVAVDGDILAIPLPACSSAFPSYATDYGLIVANGSYVITAGHCVQCSCGPRDLSLFCTPASLSSSCPSMQCRNSNLMLGGVAFQATSAGCNVSSCTYGGIVNGSITTSLSIDLQPSCPGQHQFPLLVPPPSELIHESFLAPSSSPVPSQPGGLMPTPKPSSPGGTLMLPSSSPTNGPSGSVSEAPAPPLNRLLYPLLFCALLRFVR